MIASTDTLGRIAADHPAATRVFLRHRLDFCCGGKQLLEDACRRAGLDPSAIIGEIGQCETKLPEQNWQQRPTAELIDFIVTHYHSRLKNELWSVVEAARKVERVHADKPTCPHGLAAHLQAMHESILEHLAEEEEHVFVAILSEARGDAVTDALRALMVEHEQHGANLLRLRELAQDYVVPPEACATWRALIAAAERLEEELMEHVHLENNVLFPRVLAGVSS